MIAWTQPCPTREVLCTGKALQLDPNLRHNRLCDLFPHARDGVEQTYGVSHERVRTLLDRLPDVGLHPCQGRVEFVVPRQQLPQYPPLGVRQASIERAD